jgi:hypothetical protein
LESISRDFPTIPIFAVFQPLKSAVSKIVSEGELAKRIHFIDMADDWQKKNFYPGSLVDPVHLSNIGHALTADYLTRYLLPFAKERCSTLDRP